MLKTVEDVQEKYPGIRLSRKWDSEKPVKEHGKRFVDMAGQKFNHLTVLEQFPFNTKDKKSIWIVQCALSHAKLQKINYVYKEDDFYKLIPRYSEMNPWSNDPIERNFARTFLSEDTIKWLEEIKKYM